MEGISDNISYKFPKSARILKKDDFKVVYQYGDYINVFPLRLHFLKKNRASNTRLGLSIGKKNGNAVRRNKWKRAVRETFRLNKHKLQSPCDVVIAVDWKAGLSDISKVQDAFSAAIERINLIIKERPA